MIVRFKLLTSTAKLPTRATPGSAGLDLYADIPSPVYLKPGQRMLVPTGVAVAIPEGYEGQVRPRSGLAVKHGITVVNSPGCVDHDYRGQVGVPIINHGYDTFTIEPGNRIAQLIIAPVLMAEPVAVAELDKTERDAMGFGGSGR